MTESLQDQMEAVYQAFHVQFPTPPMDVPVMPMAVEVYIDEVYPEHVIACEGDKKYQIKYTIDENGVVVFVPRTEWVEVEEVYQPVKIGARNSRRDGSRLQQIHDYAVENGAMCAKKYIDMPANTPTFIGGEIKALDDKGKIGGYLVRYSTEDDPDLTGDYFTKSTDFGEFSKLPVLYHHGFDKQIGKKRIGTANIQADDIGLWAETQLEMRDQYEKYIFEMAQAGKLGYSSGAASHTVDRQQGAKASHITQWYMAEASLTPTPAEYRNTVTPIKSLIPSEISRRGDEPASVSTDATKTVIQNNKELDMEKEELKAMLDESNKALVDTVKAEE